MAKKTIKQLEVEALRIRDELYERQEEETREKVIPYLTTFLGKCWKYKNHFSLPEKPSDYWFEYKKIIEVLNDSDGYVHFVVESFSIDKNGTLTYVIDSDYPHHDGRKPFDHWTPIDEVDYEKALANFRTQLHLLDRLRKETK